MLPKILAVDFDGTLCEDKYPLIGAPNYDVINLVKVAQASGIKVILWTCRNKEALEDAVLWCLSHLLVFDAINDNLGEVKTLFGGDTRKVFADWYLDDKALDLELLNKAMKGTVCVP